jgi:selenocysteine lyase/cysteine desulfurase
MNQNQVRLGEHMSPGGFHSFEHRWALTEAFKLHLQLCKENLQQRIHQLNEQTKQGLAKIPHLTLYTSTCNKLSSGLTCFDIKGMKAESVLANMLKKDIIMSSTPYRDSYTRFAPLLLNIELEI